MSSLTERWKPVVGYEDHYSVSNLGRIRRDKQSRGAQAGYILKQSFLGKKIKFHYFKVSLVKNGVQTTHLVHQLVAYAFLGSKPSPKHCVNHIDGNKQNNQPSNLEYLTLAENNKHAQKLGIGPVNINGKFHKAGTVTA